MSNQTATVRKPYVAPRLVEQGKVAPMTRQGPTTVPGSQLTEFDEF
ncbi:MAG: hypothetical protein IT182_11450 [Acidobacteria bacterium]|nr:hypothetical protein [Acidobacteriota bacterium]